jgi:ABC-type sugar transport system ATPase subunit
VRKNLTSLVLGKLRRWCFVKEGEEKRIARESVKQFNIMTPHIEQEVQYLSGGNQQKVILAKWINADSKLIIMDEPTRGIDVGAKAEFYSLMRLLARQGKAILMISSEFPEVIGMSDRILVMHDGQIMGELSPSEATEESILMMATGQLKKNKAEEEFRES